MRRFLWSMAAIGLALGSVGMVGGSVVGGELGPLVVGYGLLVAICALYLVAGLAIRDRAWRRLSGRVPVASRVDRLAGRRVF